jgi:hypothetical protein
VQKISLLPKLMNIKSDDETHGLAYCLTGKFKCQQVSKDYNQISFIFHIFLLAFYEVIMRGFLCFFSREFENFAFVIKISVN